MILAPTSQPRWEKLWERGCQRPGSFSVRCLYKRELTFFEVHQEPLACVPPHDVHSLGAPQ